MIPATSNRLLPLLKEAAGIITEAPASTAMPPSSAWRWKAVLVDAVNATRILKSGTTVTLDGERGAVMFGNGAAR